MFVLDNRTILFSLILVGLLSTLFSFFPSRKTSHNSMKTFRTANMAYLLGFGLLYFQGFITPLFSIVISNTLILFAFAMFCYTVNRIYSREIPYSFLFIVLSIHLLFFVFFTFVHPDTYLRIMIVSLEILFFLAMSILRMHKSRILRKSAIFKMVIISQAGYIVFLIFRMVETSLFYYHIDSIFKADFPTAVILLSSIAYHISMNLVIIITLNRQYELKALERVTLLERTHREMSRISSIPFDLNTEQKENELYESISNFIVKYFGSTGVGIHLLNTQEDKLVLVFLSDNLSVLRDLVSILPVEENYITGKDIIKHQTAFISINQYPNLTLKQKFQELGIKEIASFPINSHMGTTGTFTMAFEEDSSSIKENYDIFKLISIQIGSIIENFDLYKKLQRDASTDPLTGIANRREFLKRLDVEFSRSNRHKTPLSLLMMDIDHFKQINDTYGHDTGDFVLKELSRIISEDLRAEDVIGRYGGEEFLIILTDCSLEKAGELAERYRKNIESTELKFRNKSIRITISIGGTEKNTEDQSPETLITRSDVLLYEAKNSGRNRCVLRKRSNPSESSGGFSPD